MSPRCPVCHWHRAQEPGTTKDRLARTCLTWECGRCGSRWERGAAWRTPEVYHNGRERRAA